MAKIPGFKRLTYTDFPKQFQPVIEQLSYTINTTFDNILATLNNGVTLRDNLFVTVKDVNVTVDTFGIPTTTTAFAISNTNPIDGLLVTRAVSQKSANIFPTGGVFVSYSQLSSKVTITNVTGLPANAPFSLRIVAFLT